VCFVEISLKPLLTPDKWTNVTIFSIYMQNMEETCSNVQENMHNMKGNVQEYAGGNAGEYAAMCRICRRPIMHILHIAICKICRIWTVNYYFAFSLHIVAYLFAYCCILYKIFRRIFREWTMNHYFAYYFAYQAYLFAFFCTSIRIICIFFILQYEKYAKYGQ
jgi:hypothetical protein